MMLLPLFALVTAGVAWRHITSGGLIGGIGFAVSLFITGAAFSAPLLLEEANGRGACRLAYL